MSENDSKSVAARELSARSDHIEEAYEFFLAYAAQGLQGDSNSQVRDYLAKFERAVDGLGPFLTDYVATLGVDPTPFKGFIGVLDRDARDAQAAAQMVSAQPSIASQTIDNFNANIHVRALLTDLFLIDEILKGR